MVDTNALQWVVVAAFAVSFVLLVAVLIVKTANRRRLVGHQRRRATYMKMLSRHVAMADHQVHMGKRVAEDQAFLDAVIDIRNAVVGPEAEALHHLVDSFGISQQQTARLSSPLKGRRLKAAVALAELADESSAKILLKHLDDREPEVRVQAARGLGRMKWTPAIGPIVDRFSHETPWVRSRFADTLVTFGSSATWPLLAYIKVNHRFESVGPATAVRVLETIGDHSAVAPLMDLLEETADPEIQIAAVAALGTVGGRVAFDSVEKATRSEDWRVRAKAATALEHIGDPEALNVLYDGLHDQNWWVRRNSAHAMTNITGGIGALYAALTADDRFARDAAAEALASAGELMAARERISGGMAATRDFDLVQLVEGREVLIT